MQINELGRRVILLPKETAWGEVYLAVSFREDGNKVIGLDMQYSIFYKLCEQAAMTVGGEFVLSGKKVEPEAFLKTWRKAFDEAKPITDCSNQDLLITAKMTVDPALYVTENDKWKLRSLEELKQEHPFVETDGKFEFTFDLANPVEAKRIYDHHRLHHVTDVIPVEVTYKGTPEHERVTMDLFGEALV